MDFLVGREKMFGKLPLRNEAGLRLIIRSLRVLPLHGFARSRVNITLWNVFFKDTEQYLERRRDEDYQEERILQQSVTHHIIYAYCICIHTIYRRLYVRTRH